MTEPTENPKTKRKAAAKTEKGKRTRVPSDITKVSVTQLAAKSTANAAERTAIDAEFARREKELADAMPAKPLQLPLPTYVPHPSRSVPGMVAEPLPPETKFTG